MLGDKVQPVLDALVAAGNGRFKGIRYGTIWDSGKAAQFGRHQVARHLMLDPVFRKGFARLAASKLSFEAWMFYPQLDDLADLLRAFPEANVILNHCGGLGFPPARDAAVVGRSRGDVAALRRGHHRIVRACALHDGKQFSAGPAIVRLRRTVERHETHHQGLFGGGQGGAVPRYGGAGLPAGALIGRQATADIRR